MSLINDALKKAQKMRHEEASEAAKLVSEKQGQGAAGAGARLGAGMIALISGGVALLVCGTVLGTILVLRKGAEQPPEPSPEPATPVSVVKQAPKETPAPAVSLSLPSPPPQGTTQASDAPGPLISLPPVAAPKLEPSSTTPAPVPAPVAQSAAQPAQPSTPAPTFVISTPEPDHQQPNPAAQRFIDRARVTGVRRTSTGAKVIINDKVYRINDVVDRTLGLRLTEAEADRLVFTDEYGHSYVRNF